jgi:DNA-binding CsgD family transcriptional regulator/tetratricopeptide (TPR) repeat protein
VTLDTSAGRTVGRAPELARIDAALEALGQGRAGCVAIEGEPGIGKTRLLADLRTRAEERGCLVLAGTAAEFERDLPFSVWADALDAYVASQELDLGPALGAELAEILPSRAPDGADRGTLAEERYRVHRAARRLLALLAEPRPLVLVLDDLHWSDDASLELLTALLRRGAPERVLLAAAFRPGRVARRLATALAASSATRLQLAPLAQADATELLAGHAPDAAAAIYRHSGGNPFYLEQLARTRAEPGAASGEVVGVPAAVAASLEEELAALAGPERALLDAAAVAGEPFDPDLAGPIAGLSDGEALAALDGLLAADLVRPTAVPRRFAFRHPLVRRAVYEAVPGGRRLQAHARAAETLARRGATAAERAHHVEHSASACDEDAIALLLDAAAATAPRAPAASAHWCTAALRLLPGDDRERHVAVRMRLAGAQRSLGELERCRATLLEALELQPEGSVELIARCAAVEHWLGRHKDAHRRLTAAWEALPERTGAAAAALQIELVIDGLYELDYDATVAMGRRALATAADAGERLLLATATAALCLAEAGAGEIAAARERLEQASALVDALDDAELAPRVETLFYLGWAENYLERYEEAIAHVDRGIAILRGSGEGGLLIPLMLVKGYTFEMLGRTADAIELCERAVEAARLSAAPHELAWALNELAYAHYHAGDLGRALAAGEESAQVGGRLAGATMPAGGGGPGWVLAMSHFEAGDVERAWEGMHTLGDDALHHKIPVERCFDWEVLALVEIARGDDAAAEAYVRRAEAHAEALGLNLMSALAARARAALLLSRGAHAEAARAAARSAELATAIGARLPAAFALGLGGRALAAAGDRRRAVAVLKQAEQELDACGSVRVRDELRRELRRLGARAEPRGPATGADSGVAALTAREREVAELVTDRHTNREIAAALFLSEKTVESHLRNVFAKLGASSRVDVARILEREARER